MSLLLCITTLLLLAIFASSMELADPQLNQQHFRVTTIPDNFFLRQHPQPDGSIVYSGFLADMLEAVSHFGNFTYDLVTPSGFGSMCHPQLNSTVDQKEAYSDRYHLQFDCGTNDVNELQNTNYSTDLYLGMYHISPERQKLNHFTIPFQPPHRATPAMMGTATGIRNIDHLVELQQAGEQPPACTLGASVMVPFLQTAYPDIQLIPFFPTPQRDLYSAFADGTCSVFIVSSYAAETWVLARSQEGRCLVDGKPLGVIGEPMDFGLPHLAIGVGKHLDIAVVNTLSYWMNVLMLEGTMAGLYQGGTGKECGYVVYPQSEQHALPHWAIVVIAIGAVGLATLLCWVWHRASLKRQEARYKKRFVQQIARNIQIGPRPGSIRPEKLTEEILHIGQGKDFIKKEDLAAWMSDIKMDFISEKDFEALWHAMDIDDSGEVDAVEFIVFLSACGPEFEKVYSEQERMPKVERFKLAARRLSNLARLGEDGVHQIERRLDRNSMAAARSRLALNLSGRSINASSHEFAPPSSPRDSNSDAVTPTPDEENDAGTRSSAGSDTYTDDSSS